MKKKKKQHRLSLNRTSWSNPAVRLSQLAEGDFAIDGANHPGMDSVVVHPCADDHVHIAFAIANSFHGKSLELIEDKVRSMTIGDLDGIVNLDDLANNVKKLTFEVIFHGETIGAIKQQMEAYLAELTRRLKEATVKA